MKSAPRARAVKSSTQQAPYVTSPITMVSASVNLGFKHKETLISTVTDCVHAVTILTMAINTHSIPGTVWLWEGLNKINRYPHSTDRVHYIESNSVVSQWVTHSALRLHTPISLLLKTGSQRPKCGTSCQVVKALADEGYRSLVSVATDRRVHKGTIKAEDEASDRYALAD